jgi:hypothetical protein
MRRGFHSKLLKEVTCVETSYIDADRREADRRGDLVSEKLGSCVSGIGVD